MDNSALRWLGHVERKGDPDWVSNCRRIEVEGEVCRGRGMNTGWEDGSADEEKWTTVGDGS